jgi:uncharacterized repeat protein (TIGR03847 family)
MADYDLDMEPVDSITVGVEGEPGHRTFYLEASQGTRTCTLVMEKAQLVELGTHLLAAMPDQLPEPAPAATIGPLGSPGWRVGTIQIALDEPGGACTLVMEELSGVEDEPETDAEPRRVRLVATLGQMRGLADRCLLVVEGGRPLCPLCQLPMDPSGHVCPARNGHHRT